MSIEVKICGINSLEDATASYSFGAKYLGFILYEKSPRCITIEKASDLIDEIQDLPVASVAVHVSPSPDSVVQIKKAGFDYFQFHFPLNSSIKIIEEWSEIVGKANLWLAPKIPPGIDFPESLLEFADTFLIDAYSDDKFGGTGKSADWARFSKFQKQYPEKKWILAGGMGPENISAAVTQMKIETVDVNSAVESRPGVKDESKIKKLFLCLQELEK